MSKIPVAAAVFIIGSLAVSAWTATPPGEPPVSPAMPGSVTPAEGARPVEPPAGANGLTAQGLGTGAPGGGGPTNRIDLTFDPTACDKTTPCEQIVFIQTIQILVNGVPVLPEEYADAFEGSSGRSIEDDPSTPENETGTHVDQFPGKSSPYYGANGGFVPGNNPGSSGETNSPARMADQPYSGHGGTSMMTDPGTDEVIYKFETCVFCASGQDAGDYFKCTKWEYRRTKAELAAGTPGRSEETEETDGPSKGFKRAVERWSEHNHAPVPAPPP